MDTPAVCFCQRCAIEGRTTPGTTTLIEGESVTLCPEDQDKVRKKLSSNGNAAMAEWWRRNIVRRFVGLSFALEEGDDSSQERGLHWR